MQVVEAVAARARWQCDSSLQGAERTEQGRRGWYLFPLFPHAPPLSAASVTAAATAGKRERERAREREKESSEQGSERATAGPPLSICFKACWGLGIGSREAVFRQSPPCHPESNRELVDE